VVNLIIERRKSLAYTRNGFDWTESCSGITKAQISVFRQVCFFGYSQRAHFGARWDLRGGCFDSRG
jgi:hypothetical protein